MKRNYFSDFNPIVNIIYFVIVILVSVIFTNPFLLIISIAFGSIYLYQLSGMAKPYLKLRVIFFIAIAAAIINPLFNHYGVTILAYFPSGNALTLETIIFGIVSAMMFTAAIIWFVALSSTMTSDKLMYIMNKFAPILALIFSMTLRFLPRFNNMGKEISNAQKCMHYNLPYSKAKKKFIKGAGFISSLFSWSLESGVNTALSMQCRGYGLSKRVPYNKRRIQKRDIIMLVVMAVFMTVFFIGAAFKGVRVSFNPEIVLSYAKINIRVMTLVSYGAYCAIPVSLSIYEKIIFKRIKTKRIEAQKGDFRLWEC